MRLFSVIAATLLLAACSQKTNPQMSGASNVVAGRLAVEAVYPRCGITEDPNTGATVMNCELVEKAPNGDGSFSETALSDVSEISEGTVAWDTVTNVAGAAVVPARCQVLRNRLSISCHLGFSNTDETIIRVFLRLSRSETSLIHMDEISVLPREEDLNAWGEHSQDRRNLGSGNLWKADPSFSGMKLLPN